MKRYVVAALCSVALFMLAGCVIVGDRLDQFRWHFLTLPFFVFDNAKNYVEPQQPKVMQDDVNFAVAISGGGSRSAVFAAGVLEQLALIRDPRCPDRSVLDGCTVMSGVSGGSLAAAYYSLFKPKTFCDPLATGDFFQTYKQHMAVDFWMRGWERYITHPWEAVGKYYTRYRLVETLANTFDRFSFGGATFDHLNERQVRGECPTLILNAASLDTGQKFLFTTLDVRKKFCVDGENLASKMGQLLPQQDVATMSALARVAGAPISSCLGFDQINSDICDFKIASAVAASSAYPVMPGPAVLVNYCTNGYVHLADGGVNDNFGIDSIVQLYLSDMQRTGCVKKLVILSIDATDCLDAKKIGDPNGYVGAIAYGERANVIQTMRGQAFSRTLLGSQEMIQVIPVRMYSASCAGKLATWDMANYYISETDMYTVLGAAGELVPQVRPALVSALSGQNAQAH